MPHPRSYFSKLLLVDTRNSEFQNAQQASTVGKGRRPWLCPLLPWSPGPVLRCVPKTTTSPSPNGVKAPSPWKLLWPWLGGSVGQSVIPTCQGGGFDSPSQHIQESTNECINKWNNRRVFLSLSLNQSINLCRSPSSRADTFLDYPTQ